MLPIIAIISNIISFGIILAQVFIFAVLIIFIFKNKLPSVFNFIKKHALLGAFLLALGSMLGSLFYSEIAKLPPCELCWIQRFLMYPQVIILGVALYNKNKKNIAEWFDWCVALSVAGGVIAIYQYYGQLFNTAILKCSTSSLASCAETYFVTYGYITIPLMALTAFVAIIVLGLSQKINATEQSK